VNCFCSPPSLPFFFLPSGDAQPFPFFPFFSPPAAKGNTNAKVNIAPLPPFLTPPGNYALFSPPFSSRATRRQVLNRLRLSLAPTRWDSFFFSGGSGRAHVAQSFSNPLPLPFFSFTPNSECRLPSPALLPHHPNEVLPLFPPSICINVQYSLVDASPARSFLLLVETAEGSPFFSHVTGQQYDEAPPSPPLPRRARSPFPLFSPIDCNRMSVCYPHKSVCPLPWQREIPPLPPLGRKETGGRGRIEGREKSGVSISPV